METSQLNPNSSSNLTTDIDRRPFYVWLIAILVNVGTYLTTVIMEVYDGGQPVTTSLVEVISYYWYVFCISLIVSIIPIWLSGSKLKWRDRIGFFIPVFLLLPFPYLIWDMNTCTGKFCGLGDYIALIILGTSAAIFALFYLVGKFFRRWNVKISLSLIYLELLFLIVAILYLISYPKLSFILDYFFNYIL